MDDGVNITGMVETIKAIVDLPDRVTREVLPDALVAGSGVIQGALIDNAPERATPATSEREFAPLKESAVTDVEIDYAHGVGVASTGFGESGPVALWNEFGHRIVTRSGEDTGRRTDPNPFMRKTVDEKADEAIEAAAKVVGGWIRGNYAR